MIEVYCNTNRYEYDIRPLIMAFYTDQDIIYRINDEENRPAQEDNLRIDIQLEERRVIIQIKELGLEKVTEHVFGCSEYRDDVKRLLYQLLSKYTGRTCAWGTLTGVRPTKLPMKQLKDGQSCQELYRMMQERYYCSEEKARLCTDVAAIELQLLEEIHYQKGYSVYIGIPFCPTVCNYCSFASTPLNRLKDAEQRLDRYLDALEIECKAFQSGIAGKQLSSIYIGGGTPTSLNERQLRRLMSIVCECFDYTTAVEFTVEAGRPDSLNIEKLRILKEAGVTRISVNPQTMKDLTLQEIGRDHTSAQTIEIFKLARECGFDNINMDLIAGLEGEDLSDFSQTLSKMGELGPDSFTVHSLVVKRASEFRHKKEQLRVDNHGKNHYNTIAEHMLAVAHEFAVNNGYRPYYMYRQKNKSGLGDSPVLENVGYAKPGKEGIYNIIIMEEMQSILAFGAGASSKIYLTDTMDKMERCANVKNIDEYETRIEEMIERKKRWQIDGGK